MTQRLAALVAQLTPGSRVVRILPAGTFRATDGSGRPADAPAWRLDAALATALIARHEARASLRVVDYEHQTLRSPENGKPAPAAGWIESLTWRDDDGLYASIGWTDAAAAMIAAGEYRYLSPVFAYDKSGAVLDIRMAGLTNDPGLDGLTDLAALSAHFPEETQNMDLKLLLAALALGADTTEADALAAVASLKARADSAEASVAALKAAAPDPALYAPVATVAALQTQVAALTGQIEAGQRAALIESGMADGRILPAMMGWAESLTSAALKAYLDTAQPIAALTGTQTGGAAPAAQPGALDETQVAVCRAMGLTPEQFQAAKV